MIAQWITHYFARSCALRRCSRRRSSHCSRSRPPRSRPRRRRIIACARRTFRSAPARRSAPKYSYLFSPDGTLDGSFALEVQPCQCAAALAADKAAVIAQISKSFDKWSSQCGITYVYEGETDDVAPNDHGAPDGSKRRRLGHDRSRHSARGRTRGTR